MRPLFLSLCLFISIDASFAQSSPVKSSFQSSGEMEDSTIIVSLCSNANGEDGFIVKNKKGHTEFQTVDQFLKSKGGAYSKSNPSRAVSEKAIIGAAKGSEVVASGQSAVRDSSALLRPYKLPPVLSEASPSHN
jgi:hypothetical protein